MGEDVSGGLEESSEDSQTLSHKFPVPKTSEEKQLHEELGITGLYPEYRHRLEYHADVGNSMVENEVVDVFLAHVRGSLKIAPNPDEVMDIRWIDYHDLLAEVKRHPDRFTPWLKIYLHNHADTIFGPDLIISAKS